MLFHEISSTLPSRPHRADVPGIGWGGSFEMGKKEVEKTYKQFWTSVEEAIDAMGRVENAPEN